VCNFLWGCSHYIQASLAWLWRQGLFLLYTLRILRDSLNFNAGSWVLQVKFSTLFLGDWFMISKLWRDWLTTYSW
jgi:hypothetical protein